MNIIEKTNKNLQLPQKPTSRDERFARSAIVLGDESLDILKKKSVTLFGLGGVGSYVAEALIRGGIGRLVIVDSDYVDISNTNRQLVALTSTIGKKKTDIVASRLMDINPKAEIIKKAIFFLPTTPAQEQAELFERCDYIADAIDTISSKIYLAELAQNKNIPIIAAMGCGNKLDNTLFKIADISQTKVCPLCKVMRHELKKRNISPYTVVYSEEPPIKSFVAEEKSTDFQGERKHKAIPGSTSWVPGVAGLIMAGRIIKDLLGFRNK